MQDRNNIIKPHLWSICSEIDPSIGRVNVYNRLTNYLNRSFKLNLSNNESTDQFNNYESLRMRYNLCYENVNNNEYPICFDRSKEEFENIAKLGEGGFGEVYKVRHNVDKAFYALKKIRITDDDFHRKLNEVQIWANYSKCPYIVEYKTHWIEYSTSDNASVINETNYRTQSSVSSQFINSSDEEEVTDVINKSKRLIRCDLQRMSKFLCIQMELCLMTLSEAIKIIRIELNVNGEHLLPKIGQYLMSELSKELLSAIDYLHSNQILHRDLKANNILITNGYNNSFIKISDFGLSKKHSSYTFARQCDSDIYDLGLVMGHMFGIKESVLLKYRFSSNWSKIVASNKKLKGESDAETKLMDNYKLEMLSLIYGMLDKESVTRKLWFEQILNRSNSDNGFVTFDEIKTSDKFRSICYEMWTKRTLQDIEPLSSYIIYKKALKELEIGRKFGIHSGSDRNQSYFDRITNVRKLCKISCMTSNIVNDTTKENLYKIIIHAFTIWDSFEQTINYIETEIEKLFGKSEWKCLLINHYSHMKVFKFYDNLTYYCVEFMDGSGSERIEKRSLVIFEMRGQIDNEVNEMSAKVDTLTSSNMSEKIIDDISRLILYTVNNLPHDSMTEFVCLNLRADYNNCWNCVSLRHTYLYPLVSYHAFDNESRMYCAMRYKQYCFVVTDFKLIQSSDEQHVPFDDGIKINHESNIDQYLSKILCTNEGEKLSKQKYNAISKQNKSALYEIYVSTSVRQHVQLFEVKLMKLFGKTCFAIINYNDCVGYTDRNFEFCYCLRDSRNNKCKIALNWL